MPLTQPNTVSPPTILLVDAHHKHQTNKAVVGQLTRQETSYHFTAAELKQHNQLTKANALAQFIMDIGQGEKAVTCVSEVIEEATKAIAQLLGDPETKSENTTIITNN